MDDTVADIPTTAVYEGAQCYNEKERSPQSKKSLYPDLLLSQIMRLGMFGREIRAENPWTWGRKV